MNWEQIGQTLTGEFSGDFYGYSISLNGVGDIVAVGARNNSGADTDAGHVRVYHEIGITWIQIGDDIDGELADNYSGFSVSLNAGATGATVGNSIVAIGAPYNDDTGNNVGHVRIYQYDGITWTQLGRDIDGEALNDLSGYSVSLNSAGNIVAIGATDNDSQRGHVRVYRYDQNGITWIRIGDDIDGENLGDKSGWSVFIKCWCNCW